MTYQALDHTGIEFSTYLQMLSFEKKSCILYLQIKKNSGILCMKNGVLLNAQTWLLEPSEKEKVSDHKKYKEDAVIEMLQWKEPKIKYSSLTKNVKCTIEKSIEYLVFESARLEDEKNNKSLTKGYMEGDVKDAELEGGEKETTIETLHYNMDIYSFLILDNQSNIVLKKAHSDTLNADFLSYIHFAFTSSNKVISPEKARHYMHFNMENGESILIYCSDINIFGFSINPKAELDSVSQDIVPLLMTTPQSSKIDLVVSI